MIRRRILSGPLLALLLLLPAPAAQAIGVGQLQGRLASQMSAAGGSAGAYVMDLDRDRRLYALRPDTPYVPASVNKLFTTSTALRLHGAGDRLETTVLTRGSIDEDGVLTGNLYLRGGGDPTLGGDDLAALAGRLTITKVRGAVFADESRFDLLRGSASTGGRLDPWMGGQLGALVVNRGYDGRTPHTRPAAVAADAFRRALERRGIEVTHDLIRLGEAHEDAEELASIASPTIGDLVAATNTPSDNYLAEMLLKDLGATFGDGGTTSAGARVVRSELAELDVRPQVVDGSGLSRSDRTNARQVVLLLDAMSEGRDGGVFVRSLAVAGRTGTLEDRMRHGAATGRCRAKTGTLSDVSALAGICETRGGRRVGFAFLMNSVSPSTARRLQDRMVNAIARLR
ncbi:MAG TPA: D-alanyl-D-alanine carboxypeptidase/D-alanyl-D-alanine-endopeptidase [Capillimicrobium sp.]|nr:D-alanyl-D-alanine carboxypeptidase/D-alanyl-D-alanine-endopeptidase [Capillimicrobium sp.]